MAATCAAVGRPAGFLERHAAASISQRRRYARQIWVGVDHTVQHSVRSTVSEWLTACAEIGDEQSEVEDVG